MTLRSWDPYEWRRTQRIRTAAELPVAIALVETSDPPVYQRIAGKALHLRQLGLKDRAIARRLGVTDKTVTKAIRWLLGLDTRLAELDAATMLIDDVSHHG